MKQIRLIFITFICLCFSSFSLFPQSKNAASRFFVNGQFIMPEDVTQEFRQFLANQYCIPFIAHPDTSLGVNLPKEMFFANGAQYDNFWNSTPFVEVELDVKGLKHRLQPVVAQKLMFAIADLKKAGIKFKVRGTDGVFRSWKEAEGIWLRRIKREVKFHQPRIAQGDTLSPLLIDAINRLGGQKRYFEQAALIHWIETNYVPKMMFGKLHKGPLYASCAAPGTSHHTLGIAIDLDIVTLRNAKSLQIMAKHGFFRCIVSDFAHFVYLGNDFKDPQFLKSKNIRWIKHADGSMYLKFEP